MRHSPPLSIAAVVVFSLLAVFPLAAEEVLQIPMATALARVQKKVQPTYPPAAKQLSISGSQEVTIVVNAQGDVEEVTVTKGNVMFTNSSIAALKQWKFLPYVKDGQAVKFAATILLNYSAK